MAKRPKKAAAEAPKVFARMSVELQEEDIGTLQAAVENLRSADKTDSRIEAAWRIAFRLEGLAKRAEVARRASETQKAPAQPEPGGQLKTDVD